MSARGKVGADSNTANKDKDNDVEDAAERSSDFSSISEDSLPPIHAFGYTYHGSGRMMLPNDEAGAQHMALFHELYKLCLNGRLTDSKLRIESDYVEKSRGDLSAHRRSLGGSILSTAVLQQQQQQQEQRPSQAETTSTASAEEDKTFRILDVGSGNGLWAVEMARAFPDAEVLGVDLTSALLPKDVPPNLNFEILDVTEPWGPRLYDLIHFRNPVGGGFSDWPKLIGEAWAHLKPGGQIELSSMRPKFYDVEPLAADLPAGETPEIGSACRQFEIDFGAMCMAQGIDWDPLSRVSVMLTRLGAESVRERGDWLPVRNWGGDPITRRKGELAEQIIEIGLEQWALMLFSRCGWKEDDTRELLGKVKEEVNDPKTRSMFRL